MNVLRRIRAATKQDRDPQTLYHLIKLKELDQWKSVFAESKVTYFDFFTLLTPFFSWNKHLAENFYEIAKKLDHFLLNILGLKFLAFKFVFQGTKK